jgi:hypothetical protein
MLTAYLEGRLGNQMFQIANVIGISAKTGEPFSFRGDYDHLFPKIYKKTLVVENEQLKQTDVLPWFTQRLVEALDFGYHVLPNPNANELTVYKGYFQSEKFFSHCSYIIREVFSPEPQMKSKLDQLYENFKHQQNVCTLHVRRGDYLELKEYHHVLDVDYYIEATNIVKASIEGPIHWIVFSDDLSWCKENFTFLENVTFEDSLGLSSSLEVIYFMSYFQHHICANSSFSWWGAWLSRRKGINILPQKWFGFYNSHLNVADVKPKGWIRI